MSLVLDRVRVGALLLIGFLLLVILALALGLEEKILYPLAFASGLLATAITSAIRGLRHATNENTDNGSQVATSERVEWVWLAYENSWSFHWWDRLIRRLSSPSRHPQLYLADRAQFFDKRSGPTE